MTATQFKQLTQARAAARVETPVTPVQLPDAGKMLNVMLGMLLLILLSSVVMHYL